MTKPALFVCFLLGAELAAAGQSRRENLKKCVSSDPDGIISGCSALIQAGRESTASLAGAYWRRGQAYTRKGDHDHAIQDYSEAIRVNPKDASDYYFWRGNAYDARGDHDHAIEDLNEAIRLKPNWGEAYENRGVAFVETGDYGRAVRDLSEAIHLAPNHQDAYYDRGYAYLLQPNLAAAIADFEHVISAAPSSTEAISAVVMLHVANKRQGHDDAQQLASVAAVADLSRWPGPVLKFDLERITADELIAAAANGSAEGHKRQICEADYFLGEDAVLHDQAATALAHFRAARDSCGNAAAVAELKRLGAPNVPPVK